MDGTLITASLLMGLGGSLHCASMCGPLVFSVQKSYGVSGSSAGVWLYHFGRIAGYLSLAFVFSLLQLPARLFGVQQYISLVSGVLLLLLVFKDKIPFVRNILGKISNKLSLGMQSSMGFKSPLPVLGFLNGLLPCGLSYAAAAVSLSYGSTSSSLLFMTLFGLGTLPMFIGASVMSSKVGSKFRFSVNHYMKYALGITATLLILRGAGLGIPYISPAMETGETEVSCCHVKE